MFIEYEIVTHIPIARQRLSKHVQTNTTAIGAVFSLGPCCDRCYVAASVPMDWLDSDHVGTPTDTHAIIEELYFLCVVRIEGF
jgi:hypothetical protein